MAYQSLYRRYRSQKFSEVLGQPHVTTGLKSAVADGRYGHAYLFSGPRGTGKTSTARVLAKALNCENLDDGEPCGTCESCTAIENGKSFDLHELDAASHNKVDDIRDLISKVQLGSPGRTKVYILDEVHMLSSGAENALLKTLEEPPDHVVFVLATTEPQKVVPTIRSRTQHFEFHLLPADVLAEHVRWVIDQAELDVPEEAIDYVLRQGGGSARDTLSALDLVAAAGGIPEGTDVAESLLRAIGEHDPTAAIAAVQEGLELGREPRTIGEDMLAMLRNAFLASMGAPLKHLNDHAHAVAQELAAELGPPTLTRSLETIGETLVDMRQAPDPRVPLEVALLRLTRRTGAAGGADAADLTDRIEALEARVAELESRGVAAPNAAPPAGAGPDSADRTDNPAPQDTPPPRQASAATPPSPRRRGGSAQRPARAQGAAERTTKPEAGGPDRPSAPPPPDTPQPSDTAPAEPAAQSDGGQPTPAEEAPTPEGGDTAAPLDAAAVQSVFAAQLDELSQKVRVRFKGGQISGVADNTITFAVPNSIHRDRCDDVKGEVEQALTAHFGRPVSLEVVVDENPTAPSDPAKLETRLPSKSVDATDEPDDEDVGPVAELADATDHSSRGIDRLTQAFPGSTVVENPSS